MSQNLNPQPPVPVRMFLPLTPHTLAMQATSALYRYCSATPERRKTYALFLRRFGV